MQIQFYHLLSTPLEAALPKLLEKIHAQGLRAHLKVESAEAASRLSQHLWTYRDDAFLPHGTSAELHAPAQPILLCASLSAQNKPDLLLITDGTAVEALPEGATRLLDLFNGNDSGAEAQARQRWKQYKAAGHELAYWRQTPQGGWEKAA